MSVECMQWQLQYRRAFSNDCFPCSTSIAHKHPTKRQYLKLFNLWYDLSGFEPTVSQYVKQTFLDTINGFVYHATDYQQHAAILCLISRTTVTPLSASKDKRGKTHPLCINPVIPLGTCEKTHIPYAQDNMRLFCTMSWHHGHSRGETKYSSRDNINSCPLFVLYSVHISMTRRQGVHHIKILACICVFIYMIKFQFCE